MQFAGLGTASIVSMDSGSAARTLSTDSSLYLPAGLLFDGTDFISIANHDGFLDGYITRVPGSGGAPTPIASGSSVAMDDHCLYYSSILHGIFSVRRSYDGPPNP